MTEAYGEKWTRSHGEAPGELWSEALSKLAPEEIKRGLEVSMRENIEWPPTLPEFVSHCKPPRVEPMHVEYRLPHYKNCSKEVAEQNINKIKNLMRDDDGD